jgi:hypothetical protein
MARLTHSVPKYRKHKASGQALVAVNGRRQYLGLFGSKASRIEFDRLIGEWLQNGRSAPSNNGVKSSLVAELMVAYLSYAKDYDRKRKERTIRHARNCFRQASGR